MRTERLTVKVEYRKSGFENMREKDETEEKVNARKKAQANAVLQLFSFFFLFLPLGFSIVSYSNYLKNRRKDNQEKSWMTK